MHARRHSSLAVAGAQDPGAGAAAASKTARSQQIRQKRLMKELKDLHASPFVRDGVFRVELAQDNLFEWNVFLHKLDADSLLAKDLAAMGTAQGIDNIWLRVTFPDNFPFDPPFVRVVAPFVQGGYVLAGGAVCMELLTPAGWSQAYTMEPVIVQVMATMIKGDARIVRGVQQEFSERAARSAYAYLVQAHAKHGWATPPKAEG